MPDISNPSTNGRAGPRLAVVPPGGADPEAGPPPPPEFHRDGQPAARREALALLGAVAVPGLFRPAGEGRVVLAAGRGALAEALGVHRSTMWRRLARCPAVTEDRGRVIIDIAGLEALADRPQPVPSDTPAAAGPARRPSPAADLLAADLLAAVDVMLAAVDDDFERGDYASARQRSAIAHRLLRLVSAPDRDPDAAQPDDGAGVNADVADVAADAPSGAVGAPKRGPYTRARTRARARHEMINLNRTHSPHDARASGASENRSEDDSEDDSSSGSEAGTAEAVTAGSGGSEADCVALAERGFAEGSECGEDAARRAVAVVAEAWEARTGRAAPIGRGAVAALARWPAARAVRACELVAADIAAGSPVRNPGGLLCSAARTGSLRYFPLDDPAEAARRKRAASVDSYRRWLRIADVRYPEEAACSAVSRCRGDAGLLGELCDAAADAGLDAAAVRAEADFLAARTGAMAA